MTPLALKDEALFEEEAITCLLVKSAIFAVLN